MNLSPKEEAVLKLLGEDTAYKNYFFGKVSDLKWFDELKKQGYFDPINAPAPKPANQEGLFSIPWWNVLDYLEKVSGQVNLPNNEGYIDELLQIIKDVSNYTDSRGEHIDNYHTWWSFVKILLNIPKGKIPIEIIELIPIWIDSKFNASHVGSEIGLKLLPKFLSGKPSPDDITKAEKIVEYITDIKSIKLGEETAKLYNKEEKFKLKVDAYWVMKVFEKHSKDIEEKCTNDIVFSLGDRVRSLLKSDESSIPLESGDKAYLLSLSSEDSKYSVKVFDKGKASKSDILGDLFVDKEIDSPLLKELTVDETSMEDFINIVFDELIMDPPFAEMDNAVLRKKIHNLYRNFHDSGTYASLYDKSRSHFTEPLGVLTFVLKSILIARAKKHVDKTKDILKSFFNDKYFYFPKMALYIIGNNIADYEDIFWDALEGESNYFFYEGLYFGDELRRVLEVLRQLSGEHKEKLITIITKGPRRVLGEDKEEYILRWKQERYHALIKDHEFKGLYDSLKSQTGKDIDLHAAVGEIKVRSGEGPPPLTKEEVFRMSNEELAAYLMDFKTKGFWEGPTVGGLAKLMKECVAEQPVKFTDNLKPFINSGFTYIYEIIDGIREAWNKKQDIAWGELFEFIERYIDRAGFWEDHFVVEKDDFLGGANHSWVIATTMELIREGTKDDSWAYNKEYFPKAEKIIFLTLSKLEPEEEKDITDYVTHTINTAYGKTIIALLNHALRIARVNDKKEVKSEIKWNNKIKRAYDDLLEKKIIESYTLLGKYLPNLFYLDKAWAEEKVKNLYPETVDRYWESFMDGYLSIGQVYEMLYGLMIPHYERGIIYDFKEKRDNGHLVQHIALGYLLGYEKLDNPESLLRKVLDTWDTEQILNIISFFWSQQRYIGEEKEESKKIVKKIISFWKWVYDNKYKTVSEITDDDKKIQSAFTRLTVFLPTINEEYSKWLMLAAPYANENYNSSFFVEYLDKFDDSENISYAGKIFLEMLKHFIPDFDKEHIRSIVEKLYKNGQTDSANKICEIYGKKMNDFLRDLWESYNKTE